MLLYKSQVARWSSYIFSHPFSLHGTQPVIHQQTVININYVELTIPSSVHNIQLRSNLGILAHFVDSSSSLGAWIIKHLAISGSSWRLFQQPSVFWHVNGANTGFLNSFYEQSQAVIQLSTSAAFRKGSGSPRSSPLLAQPPRRLGVWRECPDDGAACGRGGAERFPKPAGGLG